MVFGKPSSSKSSLEILAPEATTPGGSFVVGLSSRAGEAIQVHAVGVELLGHETYYTRETRRSGLRTKVQTVQRETTFMTVSSMTDQDITLEPGSERRWDLQVRVPEESPPTCSGKLVDIHWRLRAKLDAAGHVDLIHEAPIRVIVPAPRGEPVVHLEQSTYEECELGLELPEAVAGTGEVRGRLTLRAKRTFKARKIRISLIRSELAGTAKKDVVVSRQDVSRGSTMNAGEALDYSFALRLPPVDQPTASSPLSRLSWRVVAWVDRPMRKDFHIGRQVVVCNAVSGGSPAGKAGSVLPGDA